MRRKFAAALVLAALVSVLGSAETAQADTTTVIATEDTFTAQSNPDTTQGSSGSLLVNASPRERRAYVKFTVTGIPDGSTEVRAVLRLWASTSSSATFTAQAVASSWSESTLTWNTQPPLGTALASVTGVTAGQASEFDVSAYVTGNGTYALVITGSGDQVKFISRESTAHTPPELGLTWTPPTTTTTSSSTTTSTTTTTPPAGNDQLPDLAMARLRSFSIENTTDGRRLLRFTTVIVNIGAGPLEVRGTRASATDPWTAQQAIYDDAGGFRLATVGATFIWAGDGHNHWHVKNLESFELQRLSDGSNVGISPKSGFCFGDNYQYNLTLPGAPQSKVYSGSGCAPNKPEALSLRMGVSVGWGDTYSWRLPDQYIDISSLPDGSYRLLGTADTSNQFFESNETNNSTWVNLSVSGSTVTILKRAPNP